MSVSNVTSILSLGASEGGGSTDYGAHATKAEKRRKNLIRAGLDRINAVYGGGTVPNYSKAGGVYDPNTPYYTVNNYKFSPFQYKPPGGGIGMPSAGWFAHDIARNQLLPGIGAFDIFGSNDRPPTPQELLKKGRLYTKTDKTYEGFTPDFFQKRQQDYIDYAMPQLGEQYRNTSALMRYGLANRGLTGGSVARKSTSDLARSTGTAEQTIVDTARQQATALRDRIEAARAGDINTLYQTADPGRATSQAISNASSFQTPSSFVPIANMFANLANQYYLGQVLNTYRQPATASPVYAGGGASPYYGSSYDALPGVGGVE